MIKAGGQLILSLTTYSYLRNQRGLKRVGLENWHPKHGRPVLLSSPKPTPFCFLGVEGLIHRIQKSYSAGIDSMKCIPNNIDDRAVVAAAAACAACAVLSFGSMILGMQLRRNRNRGYLA
ncbi:hypothetical protein L3X38_039554 [Prunus dulcis]|uniref:Uncharacterized protein n=1 Tax=Prunus dulcis TaxID=3755 RepID=A0AAD4V9I6_PRUDU|nr:hypothetical protein L3X38_039554 [Prunus dulcis]